jgi:hypothetical protein
MHNQPDDHQHWVVADHHLANGSIRREMLVVTKPYNGRMFFRIDQENGRSMEFTISEKDAHDLSAFLAPKPDLRVVPDADT